MRHYYYRKATVEESCDLSIKSLKNMLTQEQAYGKTTWTHSVTGKVTALLLEVIRVPQSPLQFSKTTAVVGRASLESAMPVLSSSVQSISSIRSFEQVTLAPLPFFPAIALSQLY